jgi:anti-sigma regulatory factor (Ser/Thr protein kinase)
MLHAPPVTDPADLPRVRDLVAAALPDLTTEQRDRVVLAVSELVTNALLHAGRSGEVRVRHVDGTVRVEVDDPSTAEPRPCDPDPREPGGRGLRIVDHLARTWGVDPGPNGKTVWCEIGANGRSRAGRHAG